MEEATEVGGPVHVEEISEVVGLMDSHQNLNQKLKKGSSQILRGEKK